MIEKQLKIAYKYPFCRRCKKKLDKKWCKELKKKKSIPLCKECLEPMMRQFEENLDKWRKFRAR